jgi:Zn-dependent protease
MINQLYIVPILLFSVVVHEIAHGWMALRLGDPTARDMGRLTLNPIPHIDLVGSVIIPLMSLAAAGQVFLAWAKPVPINPANFTNPRRDDVIVSVVGPLSNLVLALGCSVAVIVIGLGSRAAGSDLPAVATEALTFLLRMFYGGIYLNVVLAVFNMVPVPPLDGSHLLVSVLPPPVAYRYARIGFAGVLAILLLMRIPFFNAMFTGLIQGVFFPFRMLVEAFQ